MPPLEQPPATEYPIDYLNQIAAPVKKSGGPSSRTFLIALVGLVVAVIVFVGVILSQGSGTNTSLTYKAEELNARVATLKTLIDKNHATIRSTTLRTYDSNLSIFLASAGSQLKEPLTALAPNIGKSPTSAITTGEKKLTTDLQATLDDAQLAGTFDRTYAREIAYQIDLLIGLMNEVYTKTNNSTVRGDLETLNSSIAPIKNNMSAYADEK